MLALQQALEILEANTTRESWDHQDDLCDCVFQRIGYWMNPYIGETLEVRWCCVWKELFALIPEIASFIRTTKHEPAEWNGETEMPRAIHVRQVANDQGVSVAEARELDLPLPAGRPILPKPQIWMPWSGEYVLASLG